MTKEQILKIRLEDLNIHFLTLGVARHNRRTLGEKLVTVGDVCKKYPFRLTTRMRQRYGSEDVGTNEDTINQFKAKLTALGLTPDDWPALVPHKELLTHLSKEGIMELPLAEVLVVNGYHTRSLCKLMSVEFDSELSAKKVRDFIQINPEFVDKEYKMYLFEPLWIQFATFRRKLIAKGFTADDCPFVKWDPESSALKKAEKILRNEGFKGKQVKRFAQFLVRRNWVV